MSDSTIIINAPADAITDAGGKTLLQSDLELQSTLERRASKSQSAARVYSRNVLVNAVRMGVFGCIGVLLPAFLTHRLPTAEYGAWTLILQIAGYIGYLDFGIQIAVSKYIAEHAATNDLEGCARHASAGAAVTCATGTLGILFSLAFAAMIPRIFPAMPAALAKDVARGVLLIGFSTAVQLGSSAFSGIFIGLQRYAIPTSIDIGNKLSYAVLILVMVSRHSSLTAMGAGVAVLNVVAACLQVTAWRLFARQVPVAPRFVHWPVVKRMMSYCAVLGIWTAGMLLITGLDTTIVGHVDFAETAFYAIAATPITFLTMTLNAGLGPLMPVASAMSVTHKPGEMGEVLARGTRYAFIILQLSGLPLLLFGYAVLTLWVGPVYARHGLILLRILIAAHIVRNLCAPYATMVIATGMQRVATWAGVCEALVNLTTSVLLGMRFGAVGVALGTLIGAVVGVTVHYLLSMRRTQPLLAIRPADLLRRSVLRPSVSVLPTVCLLPLFWRPIPVPMTLLYALLWAVATGLLLWFADLNREERGRLLPMILRRPALVEQPSR